MLFYASKVFGFFAIPSNFIILVGIVGALLLRTRFSRVGLAARRSGAWCCWRCSACRRSAMR